MREIVGRNYVPRRPEIGLLIILLAFAFLPSSFAISTVPLAPSCFSPADLGSSDGSSFPDGLLSVSDAVLFTRAYFEEDSLADFTLDGVVDELDLSCAELYYSATAPYECSLNCDVPVVSIVFPGDGSSSELENVSVVANVSQSSYFSTCSLLLNDEVISVKPSSSSLNYELFNLAPELHSLVVVCSGDGASYSSSTTEISVIAADSFSGNTTDLDDVDLDNITNLTLEVPSVGQILFDDSVDLSGGADLDSNVRISSNEIFVNSTSLPELNKSAVLTFFELELENPVILRDGVWCDDCSILDSSFDLSFRVPHFTTYVASENSQLVISDDSDLVQKYPYENIFFYANYTNTTNGAPIVGAVCEINFTGSSPITMTYDTDRYVYNRTFNSSGVDFYTISCNGTAQGFTPLNGMEPVSINRFDGPLSANNVTVLSSERRSLPSLAFEDAAPGNVSAFTIDTLTITDYWQGYYGDVEGTITLDDASGNVVYDWNITSPQGEIYASRASDVNFPTINCSLGSQILVEQSSLNQNVSADDSVNNTFSQTDHPSFSVGNVDIGSDSCPSTYTFVNGVQTTTFSEVLLSDGANNMVYTAIVSANSQGFDLGTYDFQMLVGEDGLSAATTRYFFFVEIT